MSGLTLNEWPLLAQRVLDFWFFPSTAPAYGSVRREWFRKDPGFDQEIRQGFGDAVEFALHSLAPWQPADGAQMALARILLLDQFTRNIWRDTPAAFSGDAQALQCCQAVLAAGLDQELSAVQRWFVYMPLEHAEDLVQQQRAVALFAALAEQYPTLAGAHQYAVSHHDVIARFGRFPHRNAILGRPSTEQEILFLQQPGSSF